LLLLGFEKKPSLREFLTDAPGVGLVERGMAAWMIQISRHQGVWAMGKTSTKAVPEEKE
jgi:hypothetical protein